MVAARASERDGVVAARSAHESRLNRVAHDALVAARRTKAAEDDGTLDGTLDPHAIAGVGALMDEAARAWTECRDARVAPPSHRRARSKEDPRAGIQGPTVGERGARAGGRRGRGARGVRRRHRGGVRGGVV